MKYLVITTIILIITTPINGLMNRNCVSTNQPKLLTELEKIMLASSKLEKFVNRSDEASLIKYFGVSGGNFFYDQSQNEMTTIHIIKITKIPNDPKGYVYKIAVHNVEDSLIQDVEVRWFIQGNTMKIKN